MDSNMKSLSMNLRADCSLARYVAPSTGVNRAAYPQVGRHMGLRPGPRIGLKHLIESEGHRAQ